MDQKLRLRNFDARHGEIRNRGSGQTSKGIKWRWRRKRYMLPVARTRPMFVGRPVQFSGMRVTIVHQNRHRKPPRLLSHHRHEVRSVSGKSNPGMILRQPCTYFLKGTCTKSPCEYWHPPECQFYNTESGCKAGDKCLFRTTRLTSNQTKSTKRATIHQK